MNGTYCGNGGVGCVDEADDEATVVASTGADVADPSALAEVVDIECVKEGGSAIMGGGGCIGPAGLDEGEIGTERGLAGNCTFFLGCNVIQINQAQHTHIHRYIWRSSKNTNQTTHT